MIQPPPATARAPGVAPARSDASPSRRLVCLAVALLASGQIQGGILAQTVEEEIGSALVDFAAELTQEVDSADLGGLSAAVMIRGEIVWEEGFGWADREARRPAEAGTVFRVGSITKSVTAMTMMVLVDDGRLSLDDFVERHLPDVRGLRGYARHEPFTYRQLASHTAGLDREPDLEGAAAGPLAGWEGKILASIPTTSVTSEPGSRYAYSNIGYGVLGLAISRAAGRPYTELVTETVLAPAEMTSSGWLPPEDVAVGYGNWDPDAPVDTTLPAAEHEGRGYKVPNGGLYSTAGDLLRFARELTPHARAEILSDRARRAMLTVHSPLRIGEVYGLGMILTPGRVGSDTEMLAWHDGAVAGYSAMVMVHPDTGTGVAWLRNYNRGPSDMDRITNELLSRLVGERR